MNAQNITEPRSDALQHNVSAFAASFSRTTLPGRIIFGNDALISLDEELDARKAHRTILIVSDRQGHLSRLGRRHWGHDFGRNGTPSGNTYPVNSPRAQPTQPAPQALIPSWRSAVAARSDWARLLRWLRVYRWR